MDYNYEDSTEISIWDLGERIPSATYRLAMAVVHQALIDYLRPRSSTPKIHRRSAAEFILSPTSEIWFKKAGLRQDWFRTQLNSSSPLARNMLMVMIELTDYKEYAYFNNRRRLISY